jgi:hypothetical protein
MATEQERKALAKQKREAEKANNQKRLAQIKEKQAAARKAQQEKGKKTLANIKKSIQNTSAKKARDKADREIAYNKSVAKVKDINKKAGRTLKNDPETNAQTVRSQNTRLGIPNNFSTKKKNTNTTNNTTKKTTPKKTTPRKKVNTVQGRKKVGSANAGIKSSGTTIKDFAKKEKDSRTITGQILTGGPKKRTEGEIRTRKQNQNRTDSGDINSYKQGGKRANYNAVSKEELANMTPQQRRIAKRTNRRLDRKEGRKNDRARNVAIRRGLSPQQAKDFMQNRRNRLNQAMGEFGKGLMGREQNLSNIDKRLYRKKGTGTLQNMKAEDGSTYDATAPYQGVGPNRTGRGLARTYYDGLIKTKPLALDPTIKLKDPQNDTETKDKTTKTIENNLDGSQGNNKSTYLYSDMPPAERAAARAYNKSKFNTLNPTAEGKADNTYSYEDGGKDKARSDYEERIRKAAGVSPVNKLDRSTMQGNMSSIKGRRG